MPISLGLLGYIRRTLLSQLHRLVEAGGHALGLLLVELWVQRVGAGGIFLGAMAGDGQSAGDVPTGEAPVFLAAQLGNLGQTVREYNRFP